MLCGPLSVSWNICEYIWCGECTAYDAKYLRYCVSTTTVHYKNWDAFTSVLFDRSLSFEYALRPLNSDYGLMYGFLASIRSFLSYELNIFGIMSKKK